MTRLLLPWYSGIFWRIRRGIRHTLPIKPRFPKGVWRLYWISRRWWLSWPGWKLPIVRCWMRLLQLQSLWLCCMACAGKRWRRPGLISFLLTTRFSLRQRTCWSLVLPRRVSNWFTVITIRLNSLRMYLGQLFNTRHPMVKYAIIKHSRIGCMLTVRC